MLSYTNFHAAIFDLDDTLLSNYPEGHPAGLHEESRLSAMHALGKQYDIKELQAFTVEQNIAAFRDAPVHSLEGAVWNALLMIGLVNGDIIDADNPLFREIVQLKDELHKKTLQELGVEVPGAIRFVRLLAAHGMTDHLAIASTAIKRDITLSLKILGLEDLFPDKCIISKERLTHPKPHPEAFQLAFSSLNLSIPTERVLAFEDDPRGIMSAKATGLFTCAITTRYTRKDLEKLTVAPDLIADSYTEFETLLALKS
ncbi:MAG TPA: HAD family hydrolase [Patescibacteria group bacterium]|nr:HAD family hydrolase [Patescibacteria group bacterium]